MVELVEGNKHYQQLFHYFENSKEFFCGYNSFAGNQIQNFSTSREMLRNFLT